jgi:hypothetical protein
MCYWNVTRVKATGEEQTTTSYGSLHQRPEPLPNRDQQIQQGDHVPWLLIPLALWTFSGASCWQIPPRARVQGSLANVVSRVHSFLNHRGGWGMAWKGRWRIISTFYHNHYAGHQPPGPPLKGAGRNPLPEQFYSAELP